MVGVVKRLETLLPDLGMLPSRPLISILPSNREKRRAHGGGEHDDHEQNHHVPRESSRLGVHDPHRGLGTDLGAFDVEHVDVVSRRVDSKHRRQRQRGRGGERDGHGPEDEGVADLTVEPDVSAKRGWRGGMEGDGKGDALVEWEEKG